MENGETHDMALARECREELGINLDLGTHYRRLGALADRVVNQTEKKRTLKVRCFVYEQLQPETLRPDAAEIAAAGWAPLSALLEPTAHVEPLPARAGGDHPSWNGFPSVVLPMYNAPDFAVAASSSSARAGSGTESEELDFIPNDERHDHAKGLMCLWGLTLSMVDDLLRVSSLRDSALAVALNDDDRTAANRGTRHKL